MPDGLAQALVVAVPEPVRDLGKGQIRRKGISFPGRARLDARFLARTAAISRSVFAARSTEVVGEPDMRYLTHWRLQMARAALHECSDPIRIVAERFGYRSEVAFKLVPDVSPGSDRRAASVSSIAS